MNARKTLTQAVKKLKKSNIESAHLDSEILLSHILKKTKEFIFSHPEHKPTKNQTNNYKKLITKRSKGSPVAYLIGRKEFYGLDFFVNKDVLIPRSETELMVEEVLHITRNLQHITFIDVGTGSGCIIISLIKQLQTFNFQLSCLPAGMATFNFFATDMSKKALIIAQKNARKHKVKIKFLEGNLLEPIVKSKILHPKSEIVITANLPYLTQSQIKNSASIKHEPELALFANKDGLELYEKLFKQIKLLKKIWDVSYVLCEIDPRQKIKIGILIKKELPNSSFQIKKDLKGHSRLVIINLKSTRATS